MVGAIYAAVLCLAVASLFTTPRLSLGLSVSPTDDAQVTWVPTGGMLWGNDVRPGDRVLALDGRTPSGPYTGRWTGESVSVVTGSGGQTQLHAALIRWGGDLRPLLLLSPWFMLLGTLVCLRAPQPSTGRAAYSLFASPAFTLALAPLAIDEWPLAVVAEYGAVTAFAACFLLFFLAFPGRRGSRRLRIALLTPPVLVVALSVVALLLPELYPVAALLRLGILLIYLASGAFLMLYSLLTTRERSARRGLAVIAGGTALGILPFIGLYILTSALGRPPLMSASGRSLRSVSFRQALRTP